LIENAQTNPEEPTCCGHPDDLLRPTHPHYNVSLRKVAVAEAYFGSLPSIHVATAVAATAAAEAAVCALSAVVDAAVGGTSTDRGAAASPE
jgi:hypothetical protein